MQILEILSKELNISKDRVENVVKLLDEGSTVAFIARYRKEVTGNLTDVEIREIEKNLSRLRNIEKRQEEIIKLIDEKGKLTDELREEILASNSLTILEDIYAPYKSRRKTRADIAREFGLDELLDKILTEISSEEEAINASKKYMQEGLEDKKEIIERSLDILAEDISNTIDARNIIRRDGLVRASLITSLKAKEDSLYESYHDFTKKLKDLKSFQILAINRAEKEDILTVKIEFSDDYNKSLIYKLVSEGRDFNAYQKSLVEVNVVVGLSRREQS